MDKLVQGVPGTETFLRRRDLLSFCRKPLSPDNRPLEFLMTLPSVVKQGDALILNTFHSLDTHTLSNIRAYLSPLPTFTIGPLHLLSQTVSSLPKISFWQDDNDCIQWLNSQPPKSVVYVSFGSIAVISKTDLAELWHGVVNSEKRFLWVMRRDLVEMETELGQVSAERGFISRWAPQEKVLAHPAVGCFLTHAGWNSTLESIAAGVPMICWPLFSDQQTNSRFVSAAWKVGVDMKDVCDRRVVEEMVRQVMEGEGGEVVRRAATEMAHKARTSVAKGGSSFQDLLELIQRIRELSYSRQKI